MFLKAPPADLPRAAKVAGVPFIEQATKQCGPATLAMATAWAGYPIPVAELTKEVYTPGAGGSFQSDMASAARRNGLLALPLHGLPSLMSEIAAGHPVVIFENLAFTWYPMYHYALVYGYDLGEQSIIMHSGPVKEKHWDLRKFERSWMLEDYWGLIVLPPGVLAASADDLAHATAASALEQVGRLAEAKKIFESILVKWPTSLPALIGLANQAYANDESEMAVRYLETATKAHPAASAAWHNLAIAQESLHRNREAQASAKKAIETAGPQEKAVYIKSLSHIQSRY